MIRFCNWVKHTLVSIWHWVKKHFFDSFLFALFWELFEEGLEIAIAYFITVAIIETAAKVFTVTIITQGLKTAGKRFLFPFIKNLTYREGNDKMTALRKYWDKVRGNKVTGVLSGLGFAGIVWFQTLVPFATHCWWIALLTFVVFFNIGIFFGGETLKQIQERLAEAALKREDQELIRDAQKRYKALVKQESRSEADKVKEEAKAKKNKEREDKINKLVEELFAKDKAKAEKKVD